MVRLVRNCLIATCARPSATTSAAGCAASIRAAIRVGTLNRSTIATRPRDISLGLTRWTRTEAPQNERAIDLPNRLTNPAVATPACCEARPIATPVLAAASHGVAEAFSLAKAAADEATVIAVHWMDLEGTGTSTRAVGNTASSERSRSSRSEISSWRCSTGVAGSTLGA